MAWLRFELVEVLHWAVESAARGHAQPQPFLQFLSVGGSMMRNRWPLMPIIAIASSTPKMPQHDVAN